MWHKQCSAKKSSRQSLNLVSCLIRQVTLLPLRSIGRIDKGSHKQHTNLWNSMYMCLELTFSNKDNRSTPEHCRDEQFVSATQWHEHHGRCAGMNAMKSAQRPKHAQRPKPNSLGHVCISNLCFAAPIFPHESQRLCILCGCDPIPMLRHGVDLAACCKALVQIKCSLSACL